MIKVNDFEKDLANVMGSFMEVNLDCVEKQNQEIEKLQNNWNELKKWLEEKIKNANNFLNNPKENWDEDTNGYVLARKFQIEETLKKMQELEQGKDES